MEPDEPELVDESAEVAAMKAMMEFEENAPTQFKNTNEDFTEKNAEDLTAVFDVPVKVSAVLGRTQIEISELLKIGVGSVIELDRKVGEAIDVYVNNRLIARGEVVLVEDKLGVTMTEIIKTET